MDRENDRSYLIDIRYSPIQPESTFFSRKMRDQRKDSTTYFKEQKHQKDTAKPRLKRQNSDFWDNYMA